jgi:hypothetical protein
VYAPPHIHTTIYNTIHAYSIIPRSTRNPRSWKRAIFGSKHRFFGWICESKLWATFETSLTSCVFSWVFRAQTFGLILSYIINKLFKIENTKEPIRAFPPADPI